MKSGEKRLAVWGGKRGKPWESNGRRPRGVTRGPRTGISGHKGRGQAIQGLTLASRRQRRDNGCGRKRTDGALEISFV